MHTHRCMYVYICIDTHIMNALVFIHSFIHSLFLPGLWLSETALMKLSIPARPKNLATKTVAWPWDSGESIHWREERRMQESLQPFRRTRQPLQLMVVLGGRSRVLMSV